MILFQAVTVSAANEPLYINKYNPCTSGKWQAHTVPLKASPDPHKMFHKPYSFA